MPNPTAVKLKEAIEAGGQIRQIADQLMTEIAPETSGVLDIGVRMWLAIRPGYTPLQNPSDFFLVLKEL